MKEKIILCIFAVMSSIVVVFASPVLTNCGSNTSQSSYATDASGRIDFDNSVTTACQMTFATPETPGWTTQCHTDNPQLTYIAANPDSSGAVIKPVNPLTSLAGQHPYYYCDHYTDQAR